MIRPLLSLFCICLLCLAVGGQLLAQEILPTPSPRAAYSVAPVVQHHPVEAPSCPSHCESHCQSCSPCGHCRPNCLQRCLCRGQCQFAPAGSALYGFMSTQIANGLAAQLTLYHYDFYNNGPWHGRLSPRGRLQISRLARRLEFSVSPLVIETTGDAAMDERRRRSVVEELSSIGVAADGTRVVLGYPEKQGIDGIEALLTRQSLLQQTAQQGSTGLQSQSDTATSGPINNLGGFAN